MVDHPLLGIDFHYAGLGRCCVMSLPVHVAGMIIRRGYDLIAVTRRCSGAHYSNAS